MEYEENKYCTLGSRCDMMATCKNLLYPVYCFHYHNSQESTIHSTQHNALSSWLLLVLSLLLLSSPLFTC